MRAKNFPMHKSKQLIIGMGLFCALFCLLFVLPKGALATEKDLTKNVYVWDQYGDRWQPGKMTSTNIFDTVIDEHVADRTEPLEPKLIAPGTRGNYSFTVYNDSKEPVDYLLTGKNENEKKLPLDFKFRLKDGTWFKGSETAWSFWSDTFPLSYKRTLQPGTSETIELQWQWPFERDKDEEDTSFGDLALKEDIIYNLTLNVTAEFNDETPPSESEEPVDPDPTEPSESQDPEDPPGSQPQDPGEPTEPSTPSRSLPDTFRRLMQTGEAKSILLLVIGVLILFFVFFIYRRRKKEQDEDDQEDT